MDLDASSLHTHIQLPRSTSFIQATTRTIHKTTATRTTFNKCGQLANKLSLNTRPLKVNNRRFDLFPVDVFAQNKKEKAQLTKAIEDFGKREKDKMSLAIFRIFSTPEALHKVVWTSVQTLTWARKKDSLRENYGNRHLWHLSFFRTFRAPMFDSGEILWTSKDATGMEHAQRGLNAQFPRIEIRASSIERRKMSS